MVLLSGGLDSATSLAVARRDGRECFALSFDYGQRHRRELTAAADVARSLGVSRHITLPLDLRAWGGSALTAEIDVPKDRPEGEMSHGVPITYVPARNLIFLSLAVGWAEVLGAREVYVGVNAIDYSGYPDCRPEFIASFEQTANLATRAGTEGGPAGGVRIVAPLSDKGKPEIIRLGASLGVDFALTWSCYDPVASAGSADKACGRCDSCQLRRRGFAESGVPDPTKYCDESR